jgi:hypothetical protein
MTKWEYCQVYVTTHGASQVRYLKAAATTDPADFEVVAEGAGQFIASLGLQGWELVAVVAVGETSPPPSYFYFKRPLPA